MNHIMAYDHILLPSNILHNASLINNIGNISMSFTAGKILAVSFTVFFINSKDKPQ